VKAFRISTHYRSLTIYHTDDNGMIQMETKTVPNKGLSKTQRCIEILRKLASEGIDLSKSRGMGMNASDYIQTNLTRELMNDHSKRRTVNKLEAISYLESQKIAFRAMGCMDLLPKLDSIIQLLNTQDDMNNMLTEIAKQGSVAMEYEPLKDHWHAVGGARDVTDSWCAMGITPMEAVIKLKGYIDEHPDI